jgi:hypothetical protein
MVIEIIEAASRLQSERSRMERREPTKTVGPR